MKKYLTIAFLMSVSTLLVVSDISANNAKVDGSLALNEAAPTFTLPGADKKSYTLSDYKGKYVVLEWVNYQCPFVKKHYDAGNMQKIQKEYAGKDVVWFSICSSAKGKQGYHEGKKLTKEIKKNKANNITAYLIDKTGVVGKAYQAKTTPHMVLINPDGKVVYFGAIDSIASAKKSDIKKAQNYVAAAFSALYAGKSVKVAQTKGYGCGVKY